MISSADSHFAYFVYPLLLAISRAESFAFVDCFRRLSDRLGDFARSSRSNILTQANLSSMPCSSSFWDRSWLLANSIADIYYIWQSSFFELSFPLLQRVFFHILVKETIRWITPLFFFKIAIKYPHSTGLAVRVARTTLYLLNNAVSHSELNLALRKGKARDVCCKDLFYWIYKLWTVYCVSQQLILLD